MADCDAVVIGAGMAGLAAGARLTRQGLKVLVCEQSGHIGGYAGSLTRGPYTFHAGAHHIGGFAPGDVIDRLLADIGDRDALGLIPSAPIAARYGADKVSVPFSLDELYQVLLDQAPEDQRALRQVTTELKEFSQGLVERNTAVVADCFRRWSTVSFADYLERTGVSSERAIGLLSALGPGYAGIDATGSALTMASLLATYHAGAFYVKGGTHRLAELLCNYIRQHGGQVEVDTSIERICGEAGRVAAVEIGHRGETAQVSTRAVISTGSLRQTHQLLQGLTVGDRTRARLSQLQISCSAFRLFLGFSPGYHPAASDQAAFPHWDGRRWGPDICFDPERHGRKLPVALLCFPTLADPSLAPPEAHTAFLTLLARPEHTTPSVPLQERLLAIVAELAPGATDGIEVMELFTPDTFQRATRNDEGAVFGWQRSAEQTVRTYSLGPRGAVPGLYIAGQWGPNFGVYGGFLTAESAAEAVLRDLA